ncbi:MAG: type II secretion system protein [Planctomycetota bacterium]
MHRAFTLFELLITLLVVGIVMAVAVPRTLSLGSRTLHAEAADVADLLSRAAGRQAVSSQPLRVRADANAVRVERRVLERDRRGREAWAWRSDPLLPPVTLDGGRVSRVFANGVAVRGEPYVVELSSVGGGVGLDLGLSRGGDEVFVTLFPGALRAVVAEGGDLRPPGRIDLDASGLESAPW